MTVRPARPTASARSSRESAPSRWVSRLINNLMGGSKSWFLLNYVDMPDALRIAAHAVLVVLGLVLVVRRFGWDWLKN